MGSTIIFQPAPTILVYMGIGTVSAFVTQSAVLLVHKSSSQLYHHSVLTTYYSTDTNCRKQYLVLLADPGSGVGSS
eukprot:scaffold19228_cov48-Attheya_sp.AAC.1